MIRFEIEDEAIRERLIEIGEGLEDPQPILKQVHLHIMERTATTFRRLAHGGTFRGVTWKPFADQYTRKTDGVTVPAWGGVPKVRGEGMVKGRRRPSGRRVTSGANLLRDTGRMAAEAGLTRIWRGRNELLMSTRGVKYAARQQALRPFLFFEMPEDLNTARRIAIAHIQRVMKP